MLKVVFPRAMADDKALKAIAKIEKQAISIATTQMRNDVARLTPFTYDSEELRAQKQAVVEADNRRINQYNSDARAAADSGSNWSYDSHTSTGTFHCDGGCQNAMQVHLSGWGSN